MGKKKPVSEIGGQPARKHCQDCAYYLDGKKMARFDGSILLFPIPGMRHYSFSTGPIYDRIGTTVSCRCAAGKGIGKGLPKNGDYNCGNEEFENFFSAGNRRLIDFTKQPSNDELPEMVPMGAARESDS